jgi:predicted molibdopterin-dependent oxidoreductase YjgC
LLADLAGGVAGFRYEEVEDCDLLVVIGSGVSKLVPLLDSAVHRMTARGGRLILLGRDVELYPRAHLHRDLPPAEALAWTRALLAEGHGPEEARALLSAGRRRLVLVAESALDADSRAVFQDLLDGLVPLGVGVALVPVVPAVLALRRAGISPDHYPGHRPVNETTRRIMEAASERTLPRTPGLAARDILRAAAEGRIQGLVILAGHNPPWELPSASLLTALQGVPFSLVVATHPSPLVAQATLVLPGLLSVEKAGTFVDAAGRRREVAAALPPPEGVPATWHLLARLLEALGGPAAPHDLVAVQSELVVLDQEFARGGGVR